MPLRFRAAKNVARMGDAPRAVWAVYGLLGSLLLAYFASLLLRGPNQSVQLVDGWLVGGFELVASTLCICRAFGSR